MKQIDREEIEKIGELELKVANLKSGLNDLTRALVKSGIIRKRDYYSGDIVLVEKAVDVDILQEGQMLLLDHLGFERKYQSEKMVLVKKKKEG